MANPARAQSDPGAPFLITWGYCGEFRERFDTFDAALVRFRALTRVCSHWRWGPPQLSGAGLDYDCDGDGFFCCDDGLTAEQREMAEEAST